MFSADLGGYTAPLPAATDPPFHKVALLLHGDGTNGAQNNTFVDSSTNNFTITRTGNVAQGTFSPFSVAEGQWSNYFDGSGDYLNTSSISLTGNFTIECWVQLTAAQANWRMLLSDANGVSSKWLAVTSTGLEIQFGVSIGTVSGCTYTFSQNTWYHIAIVRSGTTVSIYVNGVAQSVSNATQSNTFLGQGSNTYIGTWGSIDNFWYGYISNLRIATTALYTSNFTPSTTPLTAISGTQLLTCQSNRFKDNSSNNFTITRNGDTKITAFSPFAPSTAYSASTNGGSGYFNTTSSYLTCPNDASLTLGSSNFTFELWFYKVQNPDVTSIIGWNIKNDNSSYGALRVQLNNNNTVQILASESGGSWQINSTSTSTYADRSWNHLAVVRNGATLTVYINGISIVSGSLSSSSASLYDGTVNNINTLAYTGVLFSMIGAFSDARLVKGTAVYTSNFTPPAAPLTAVANTQLLLNCTNAGIIDNSGKNDIETVGNAQISTSVKKYGTGSMYFDGSGDSLNTLNNPNLQFGTGDFTIEMWVYKNNNTGPQSLVSKWVVGDWGLFFYPNSSIIQFAKSIMNSYTTIVSDSSAFATGQWVHVAVTRASGTTRLFINGNVVSTASDTNNYSSTMLLSVGTLDGSNFPFNGYIDDLRITKGQALYTSNFTPPTQAFPNV